MIQKSELKKEQEEETDVCQGLGVVALDGNGPGQITNIVTSSSVSKGASSCTYPQTHRMTVPVVKEHTLFFEDYVSWALLLQDLAEAVFLLF